MRDGRRWATGTRVSAMDWNKLSMMPTRRFAVCVLAVPLLGLLARAEDACSVREERFLRAITGHFSVGRFTADLTIAQYPRAEELLSVYVRRGANSPAIEPAEELVISSEDNTVPFREGSVLHILPHAGKRLPSFEVSRRGTVLCSWRPGTDVSRIKAVFLPLDRLRDIEQRMYRETGEPITLLIPGAGLSGEDVFLIGGAAMPVLSFSPSMIVLRDPDPHVGLRTIASRDFEISLRFFEVALRLSNGRPKTRLMVKIAGLDHPTRHLHLMLQNLDRGSTRLQCWKSGRNQWGRDAVEVRSLQLSPSDVHNGAVERACQVTILQEGSALADIRVVLLELTPSPRVKVPLPHW